MFSHAGLGGAHTATHAGKVGSAEGYAISRRQGRVFADVASARGLSMPHSKRFLFPVGRSAERAGAEFVDLAGGCCMRFRPSGNSVYVYVRELYVREPSREP